MIWFIDCNMLYVILFSFYTILHLNIWNIYIKLTVTQNTWTERYKRPRPPLQKQSGRGWNLTLLQRGPSTLWDNTCVAKLSKKHWVYDKSNWNWTKSNCVWKSCWFGEFVWYILCFISWFICDHAHYPKQVFNGSSCRNKWYNIWCHWVCWLWWWLDISMNIERVPIDIISVTIKNLVKITIT